MDPAGDQWCPGSHTIDVDPDLSGTVDEVESPAGVHAAWPPPAAFAADAGAVDEAFILNVTSQYLHRSIGGPTLLCGRRWPRGAEEVLGVHSSAHLCRDCF